MSDLLEGYSGVKDSSDLRPGDSRSEFARDYDRTVFCTPARRLQDKTQVFPMEPHDAVRTRLTHSLEVSTVARDLGREIGDWLLGLGILKDYHQARDVETIAATCGLLHDLGNPPFGHAGEMAIADWFHSKGPDFFTSFATPTVAGNDSQFALDFLKFDGNAQTLRLVTRLQLLSKPFGLNLTCGTLSAACKYLAASHETNSGGGHEMEKLGFFASEQGIVERIRSTTGTGSSRNPITYLVEASDDIVYSVVDIEDAVKSGVTDWFSVRQHIEEELKEKGASVNDLLARVLKYADDNVRDALAWFSRTDHGEALSQSFRVTMIYHGVRKAISTFKFRYGEIMQGSYHGELLYDPADQPEVALLVQACKSAAKGLIYRAPKVLRLEVAGRRVIHDLMGLFWEGAADFAGQSDPPSVRTYPGKLYRLTSKNYRRVFEVDWPTTQAEQFYRQIQLVTDYVCGMTDTFACTLHKQLTNG